MKFHAGGNGLNYVSLSKYHRQVKLKKIFPSLNFVRNMTFVAFATVYDM